MITKKDVEHIADLARIRLSEKEVEKFQKELGKILEFVEKLNEVPTNQVEPLTGGTLLTSIARPDEEPKEEHERLRSEEVREDLLRKAPESDHGFVKVKAVFTRE